MSVLLASPTRATHLAVTEKVLQRLRQPVAHAARADEHSKPAEGCAAAAGSQTHQHQKCGGIGIAAAAAGMGHHTPPLTHSRDTRSNGCRVPKAAVSTHKDSVFHTLSLRC